MRQAADLERLAPFPRLGQLLRIKGGIKRLVPHKPQAGGNVPCSQRPESMRNPHIARIIQKTGWANAYILST